jgi:hypothetical protein
MELSGLPCGSGFCQIQPRRLFWAGASATKPADTKDKSGEKNKAAKVVEII